jgi:hypothetical protein
MHRTTRPVLLGLLLFCLLISFPFPQSNRRICVSVPKHLSTAYWLVDDQVHFDHGDKRFLELGLSYPSLITLGEP